MNPDAASRTGNASTRGQQPRLRTVLVCDLVDSTRLLHRLGDVRGSDLLRRHDRLCRELIGRHHGREIDKSDGFLVLFDRPASAVAFALAYHAAVDALALDADAPLQARVGIHFGELLIWHTDPDTVAAGAAPMSVEGLAKPVAARLAALARPGQTLLSDVARALAERAADAEDGEPGPVRSRAWSALGHYRLKGIAEPLAVHEVAADRRGLRGAPRASDKGRRTGLLSRPVLALAPLLAIAAVALLLGVFGRGTDAVAFSERDWVMLGSLENRTADPRFDGALETALRSSLEQSRYVNVLPEQQVREALRRMSRDGDERPGRELATEVAMREGVRALLVPSVTAVDGRFFVGVDMVDPATGLVVRSRRQPSASANGVLPALDVLAQDLRQSLGEDLGEIERARMPIEQVTSPSVDALRAYTLGTRADAENRGADAILHFEQALELDPDFAMALSSLGRRLEATGRRGEGLELIRRAAGLRDRLSEREHLSLQALLAWMEGRPDAEARSRALLDLYPDHHPAAHNLAIHAWVENRFEEALGLARRASAPQSVTRLASTYLQGVFLLAAEDPVAAREAFEHAYSMGYSRRTFANYVASFAVERRFEEARNLMVRSEPVGSFEQMMHRSLGLTLAADEGNWDRVSSLAAQMGTEAERAQGREAWSGVTAALALTRGPEYRDGVVAVAEGVLERAERQLAADPSHPDRDAITVAVVYAGMVAARLGEVDIAVRSLAFADRLVDGQPHQSTRRLLDLLRARVAWDESGPDAVLALVEPMLDGHEPLLARVYAYEALAASGRLQEARDLAESVARQRGRAYSEPWHGYLLRAENVIQTNRALLRLATFSLELGELEEASRWLEAFRAAWPDVSGFPDLQQEVERLQSAISAG